MRGSVCCLPPATDVPHVSQKEKPAQRPAETNAAEQGKLAGSKNLVTDNNFHYMPRQRKRAQRERREDGSAKEWAAGRMPVLASALLSGMNITG